MPGGGGDAPPPPTGGEFLLQLLQRPHQPKTPPQQPAPSPAATRASPPTPPPQSLSLDPAVAAVGPTIPSFPFNGRDLSPPWPHTGSPPYPPNFFLHGFPQNPWPPPGFSHSQSPQFPGNRQFFGDDLRKLGPSGMNARGNSVNQQEHKLMVGSMPCEIRNNEGLLNDKCFDNSGPGTDRDGLLSKLDVPMDRKMGLGNKSFNGLHWNGQLNPRVNSHAFQQGNSNNNFHEQERGDARWGRQQHGGFNRPAPSSEMRWPPPGFPSKPKGVGNWDYTNRRGLEHNIDKKKDKYSELNHRGSTSNHEDEKVRRLSHEDRETRSGVSSEFGFSGQLDCPGPPTGSHLHSFSASDIEESLLDLSGGIVEDGNKPGYLRQDKMRGDGGRVHGQGRRELDNSGEQLMGSLVLEDGSDDKNVPRQRHNSRDKDSRSDTRGQQLLGQRMRNFKRLVECRSDIDRLNAPFLAIYGFLIPAEEEKEKQKQLLTLLEKLVSKEWPEAQLYLYGSCANSFGVSKSDIDVCLAIEDVDMNKSEILLKLADILQSDNLQNVQALTRARVPIVKLMDPSTGISCDICINNVLAVVNTKLLRDYAQIDVRLQQLAFIVKHWAKSRGVNETYHGTLSSYAYVIMCIHFLQQRRPAILPCLQGMETTYAVTIDDIECAYFDQVEKLRDFGSHNKESIAQLVWAFFDYWAYRHDYANSVISVRTGSIISKRAKDWTRRIGNDRHLICIEDPFEISHDLGRVVDKHSIKVLREEFERAANIMQYDPNPCVVLFEPYVPS